MAIDRGEKEKVVSVSIDFDKEYMGNWAVQRFTRKRQGAASDLVKEAVEDGLKRLVYPSVEREIRSVLSEKAQEQSIGVFSMNLEDVYKRQVYAYVEGMHVISGIFYPHANDVQSKSKHQIPPISKLREYTCFKGEALYFENEIMITHLR